VAKLPAIEFAINLARSVSTGYAPFFLNFGRMPRSMIWDSAPSKEFPSVWEFALQKKLALMEAHDSILAAWVKQIRDSQEETSRTVQGGRSGIPVVQEYLIPQGLGKKINPKVPGAVQNLTRFWERFVPTRPVPSFETARSSQCLPLFLATNPPAQR
jgi:hypothetical protein